MSDAQGPNTDDQWVADILAMARARIEEERAEEKRLEQAIRWYMESPSTRTYKQAGKKFDVSWSRVRYASQKIMDKVQEEYKNARKLEGL